MKQYFRYRATSLKRRMNLGFINRRFILRFRYLFDEVALDEAGSSKLNRLINKSSQVDLRLDYLPYWFIRCVYRGINVNAAMS